MESGRKGSSSLPPYADRARTNVYVCVCGTIWGTISARCHIVDRGLNNFFYFAKKNVVSGNATYRYFAAVRTYLQTSQTRPLQLEAVHEMYIYVNGAQCGWSVACTAGTIHTTNCRNETRHFVNLSAKPNNTKRHRSFRRTPHETSPISPPIKHETL